MIAMAQPRLCRLYLSAKRRLPASFQKDLGVEVPKDFDQGGHQPGPSGLMTGAETSAVVPMEVLVEQQIIPPVGVVLGLFGTPEHRAPSGFVTQEDPGQPVGDFTGDLEQVHRVAR